ncbi:hypothetical protein CDD81_5225 [Ophiocordyceps australis]|uniref:Centrosomin N-terminal motif 1 domain-containing protein n=1 Tax=Ophiocordyceps australis TaxID=1399860 RepID=A0A2C5YGY7_9HYPO|nr:hypothetical protein CDD81_5225 [Ophiocordyceps australis]
MADQSDAHDSSPWSRPSTARPKSPAAAGANANLSYYIETTAMDQTREPEETMNEDVVRAHLRDVESSFLPHLSPDLMQQGVKESIGVHVNMATSPSPCKMQNVDSSPSIAAAAARCVSRATSMPSPTPAQGQDGKTQDAPPSHSASAQDESLDSLPVVPDMTHDAGSTPGHSLRPRQAKYLSSRHESEASSSSSFATSPISHQSSDATVGLGLGYALRPSGAAPSQAMSRASSGAFLRSVSIGSMASGVDSDDYNPSASAQHGEPLDQVNSPSPSHRTSHYDGVLETPRASQDEVGAAPTDTVIAQHVRNVQVPESLAKEYKFRNGLQTPRRPASLATVTGISGKSGRSLTLKEQSSTIERLSKENFDLKLKVMFLSDRLDKLSEEGIKEMISENVDLKTSLAVLQRDNKVLRKRVKELERRIKDDDQRPSTAQSIASSCADHASKMMDEDELHERHEELIFLRERVEEYATEIERLRNDGLYRESEKRKLADMVKTFGEHSGDHVGRQEEVDVWKDLLEQETGRREQADEENRRLRHEIAQLKKEAGGGQSALHHTTNIYNITRNKPREGNASPSRPVSGMSGGEAEGSNAMFSAASTLVDDLRREREQLRHENSELRREVGAQTSMLTSKNREKDRLYQELEDLKLSQRRSGAVASSAADSLLERSASRAGQQRPQSHSSDKTKQTFDDDGDADKEELENQLAEMRDKVSEAKLRNHDLERELDGCMADFERVVEEKRQGDELVVSLQEDLDIAMKDLVALQSERDEALQEQGDWEQEFQSLRAEAEQAIVGFEADAEQRNQEIERLLAELRDRSENFDALQEEMRNMSESLVHLEDEQEAKMGRIQQLEQELSQANKELEELEQNLLEANDANQRLSVQLESSQGEISFLREEQEADKMRIGDVEAAVAQLEQGLREERERCREVEQRLQQEREQREMVANREKEEVQQFVNELNREASSAKDEVRRLRKGLSSREVEATEWKERLLELESNLREALGDLNGTRSSLLKSIAKMQRELENAIHELDTSKASLVEKDRIIKQRDALLESHALESRKVAEMLEKERVAHRNTKAQFETVEKTHHHMSQTASTQDVRIAELESTRGHDRKRLATLEQSMREQLQQRNEVLLMLWQKLSALCGREWANSNTLVDRLAVPSVEVVASRLPGFSKNLFAAVKTVEGMFASLQTRIKSVERDLARDYDALEQSLEQRGKKLERLETMVRNMVAATPHQTLARMQRLEDAYRQLKVENATLKSAQDVRSRAAKFYRDGAAQGFTGSPSPSVPRGPGDRDRSEKSSRSSGGGSGRGEGGGGGGIAPSTSDAAALVGSMDVALANNSAGAPPSTGNNNEHRWLFRLRDMESKLKMEREGRNQDRQAARLRLGGLEVENRELRERMRRTNSDAD